MGILEIARKIKGGGCSRLLKQSGNEIEISGVSAGIPNFSLQVGKFSNKVKEYYKVSQTSIALDNTQFYMCDAINKLKDNPQLQEDIIRMRLVLIAGYGQLEAILGSMNDKNVDLLSKELRTWVRKMGALNEEGMQIIKPGPRIVSKGKKGKVVVKKVMKFQGITEEQMKNALSEYYD